MPSYLGLDYDISVQPYLETSKYVCQFSLTHDKGYEVVHHPLTYLVHNKTNELALFSTEHEAIQVGERVAKNRIQEIINS